MLYAVRVLRAAMFVLAVGRRCARGTFGCIRESLLFCEVPVPVPSQGPRGLAPLISRAPPQRGAAW